MFQQSATDPRAKPGVFPKQHKIRVDKRSSKISNFRLTFIFPIEPGRSGEIGCLVIAFIQLLKTWPSGPSQRQLALTLNGFARRQETEFRMVLRSLRSNDPKIDRAEGDSLF
jgi:hypothetical protein